ncbi:DUF1772 domain-containing protein [Adhaeribacter radiodurans]|uniref:DUF1772 domain-containing protein n=1 Tax=Adhaeribacter radiodurans TaxID=2745197 RepID=A0A7L7LAN1_9BACT|nr:DUF1772 domain-containing protein [Adhaeribacter radiodurans]QMU29880.1 DUF1772 domain-containing protein [Adhaeribacter radiodurans]
MINQTKKLLLGINHSLLFLCTAMYLGTGWSLVLFSFPVSDQLTPANYYLQFVPQVTAATKFFTYMTLVMIGASLIMIIAEWRSNLRWYPIGVLLGVTMATALTIIYIIPYNEQMSAGITNEDILRDVLQKWMRLNVIRVSLWTAQWLCMMAYFFTKYLNYDTGTTAYRTYYAKAKMAL